MRNYDPIVSRLIAAVREDAEIETREGLARSILIAPFDDAGVAAPGTEKGPGFAIYIGEWRLGWWPTREDACTVGYGLSHAIADHKFRPAAPGLKQRNERGKPMSNEHPRRNRIDKFTPAEKAIYEAVHAVEAIGADTRLTAAVNKLQEARVLVADVVDEKLSEPMTLTSELTQAEVAYARGEGKLLVQADGIGSVPTAWITEWRKRVAEAKGIHGS